MFKSKNLGEITNDRLNELTGPELVELYNELLVFNGYIKPKLVKKFSDRKAALRRVKVELESASQAEQVQQHQAEEEPKEEPPKKAEKPKKEPKAAVEPKRMNLEPNAEVKHHRKGTRRGKIIDLMNREEGATIKEMMTASEWDERNVRITLNLINLNVGYGVVEDETGHFRVTGAVRGRKPFKYDTKDEIREHRAGTKRAKTIDLLSREEGATVAEVMEVTKWKYEQALEGIKLVHTYVGYGLHEDDDSRIYLDR